MKSENNKLTSAEIGHLWSSYTFDSLIHNLSLYFLNNVEDKDIKQFIQIVKNDTKQHLDQFTEIFKKEGLPVPRGTTAEDIDVNASRLFTDKFYALYGENMARFSLGNYVLAYAESTRDDIKKLFKDIIRQIEDTDQFLVKAMRDKNIYPMSPLIEVRSDVEFVEGERFNAGFFGEKRPLSVLEIKQLHSNVHANMLGVALMQGFIQSATTKESQDYFTKGKEISGKFIKQFGDKLLTEEIDLPPSLESEVLPAIDSQLPFSERLMLNHTVYLNSFGIGNYGLSLAQSQRRDLSLLYGKIIVEVGLYADNGADLLIKNKWFEQPPLAIQKEH
jgi:hypothetical protein